MAGDDVVIERFEPVGEIHRVNGVLFEVLPLTIPKGYEGTGARWYWVQTYAQWEHLCGVFRCDNRERPGCWPGAGPYMARDGYIAPLVSVGGVVVMDAAEALRAYHEEITRQLQKTFPYLVKWRLLRSDRFLGQETVQAATVLAANLEVAERQGLDLKKVEFITFEVDRDNSER